MKRGIIGLNKRESYDELINELDKDPIKSYPNRKASIIENSHYMSQLAFGFEEMTKLHDNMMRTKEKEVLLQSMASSVGESMHTTQFTTPEHSPKKSSVHFNILDPEIESQMQEQHEMDVDDEEMAESVRENKLSQTRRDLTTQFDEMDTQVLKNLLGKGDIMSNIYHKAISKRIKEDSPQERAKKAHVGSSDDVEMVSPEGTHEPKGKAGRPPKYLQESSPREKSSKRDDKPETSSPDKNPPKKTKREEEIIQLKELIEDLKEKKTKKEQNITLEHIKHKIEHFKQEKIINNTIREWTALGIAGMGEQIKLRKISLSRKDINFTVPTKTGKIRPSTIKERLENLATILLKFDGKI
jgi:hypothetical protein